MAGYGTDEWTDSVQYMMRPQRGRVA